ncbi:MAG: hypothetical protein IJZ66_00380 [Oscillibacter sp.]|nr:hypothetical protein [Oscillibacter sp.]MBQ8850892.1 hypothetical protein [Oscillibacter sp.]
MKRKNLSSALGFVLPLVLVAVLVLGWRGPLSRGAGEMMYFLAAVVLGYPCIGVFCGILAVRTGFKWLAVPFVSALGYALARGMHFSAATGLAFAFWGAVVTICAILYAIWMYAQGRW